MAFTGTERDQAKYNAYKLEAEKYEKITIIEFEETYPGLAKEFKQIQKEQYDLFAGKDARLWVIKYFFRVYISKKNKIFIYH
jgi:hypothetical protein